MTFAAKQKLLEISPSAYCKQVWQSGKPLIEYAVFIGGKQFASGGSARKAWENALWKMNRETKQKKAECPS
jgi:hypothetical protein